MTNHERHLAEHDAVWASVTRRLLHIGRVDHRLRLDLRMPRRDVANDADHLARLFFGNDVEGQARPDGVLARPELPGRGLNDDRHPRA